MSRRSIVSRFGRIAATAGCATMFFSGVILPSATAADYVAPVPEVGQLPKTVTGVGTYKAHVNVSYKCSNDERTTNYLTVSLIQPSPDESSQVFSLGYRNDNGTLRATCTGKWVHERLALPISVNDWKPLPLNRATGTLTVSVEPHGGPAAPGGWYVMMGPAVTQTDQAQAVGSRISAVKVGTRVVR